METLALNKKDRKVVKTLISKSFKDLSDKEKKELLKLTAKDFSKRFGPIMKKLANE